MTIRQKNKIPLLTWNNWYCALIDIGDSWKPVQQFGITRLGAYLETWVNLLHIFGAEGIIHSKHILEHPVNPEELPPGLINPIAIELNVAVLLAGLAGCTTLTLDGNALLIGSGNATLKFSSAGPMSMIGKYQQNMNYPTYFLNDVGTLKLACRVSYGFLGYCRTACPTDENFASYQETRIFDDLKKKCSISNHHFYPSKESNTGLRVPAVALLAADTPPAIRVHAAKHCRIYEAVSKLVRESSIWTNLNNCTTADFGKCLGSESSSVLTMSKHEFEKEPFQGQRFSKRVFNLVERSGLNGQGYKVLSLGFSWLASKDDYPIQREIAQNDAVKNRPEWPPAFADASLVLINGVIEGSLQFLPPGASRPEFSSQEDEADFHTAVSLQLQEVDWWLGNSQGVAASETCSLLHAMPGSGEDTLVENPENISNSLLTPDGRDDMRARVRALLVFRAILIATIFGLSLDSSLLEGELGKEFVLLG
jgi:hypothetical protein